MTQNLNLWGNGRKSFHPEDPDKELLFLMEEKQNPAASGKYSGYQNIGKNSLQLEEKVEAKYVILGKPQERLLGPGY